tara:strand:- start:243 stop:431 length:189 start_codon:yes stop_codon:yes gene_type:complete
MSVFDRGISIAICEKTLRPILVSHDQYKALSILVELAVHGRKYTKENGIKLRYRNFMDGEEE